MPEHPTLSDETVRMDAGGPPGRPRVGAALPAHPATAPDDTRPVSLGWAEAPDVGTANDETVRHAPLVDLPPPPDEGPGGPGGDGPGEPGPRADRGPWWRRKAVLVPAAAVAVLGAAYGVDLLAAGGDIPRSTVVGGVDIGGLSRADAARTLRQDLAPRIGAGRTVLAAEVRTSLAPADAGLTLDVDATVAAAGRQPLDPWTRLTTLFTDRSVPPVLSRNETKLTAALDAVGKQVDRAPVEATIAIHGSTPTVVQPADGRRIDRRGAASALTRALLDGRRSVRLPVVVAHPRVLTAEAQRVLTSTVTPALAAPVTVASSDGATTADLPVSALGAALRFTPRDDGRLDVSIDPAALQKAAGAGFAEFGTPAKDASFQVSGDSIRVVPAVDGTGVDPAKLAGQLMKVLTAPAPRTVTAELGPVPAVFTTEAAQQLGITERVSSFTTHFTAVPSGTNIRVVAAKVNGAIVKPGETFSLNTFTGTRGTAQGYVPAGVIEGGKFTTAVGGGISQFATTMFNAEFFAGVQDVHHQPHSYWITRYPAGREATVFDGLIDLVWKNDSPTGIYVQTQWSPGSITVSFWGTKHYEIQSVSGERRNVVTPPVQEMPDDGTCKPQSGQQGFNITVTRVFKDLHSGAVLRTEDFHTHYKAEPVIHCVPPTPPATTSPTPGG